MAVILAAVAWLLTYLLHSTVLLAGAFALAALGIVRSHAGRDTLWKVALVGGILTATAQTALRLQPAAGHVAIAARPESPLIDVARVRDVAAPATTAPRGADARFASDVAGERPASAVRATPVRETRALMSGLHVSWPAMLLNLWLVGALGFGARLVWMRRSLSHELRDRRALRTGPLAGMLAELCRDAGVPAPRLSVSDELAGPIAFGREICLPERVQSLSPLEQRAVLAHELGHVVRRDPAWLMVAALVEHVLFVQPLNRLARRRLRTEAEYLCDDWAAERADGVVLARCLAEVAGWVQGHPAPTAVAAMAGQCSQLVSRVERLLDGSARTRPVRWIIRAGLAAGVMVLVASSVPGVAAEDLGSVVVSARNAIDVKPASYAEVPDGNWGSVMDRGHMLVLAPGYTVRITGHGRIGFRQWGRALVVPDGYDVSVNGERVERERDLCPQNDVVRVVERDGDGAWDIAPVRLSSDHASYASTSVASRSRRAHEDADAQVDASMGGDADAAIDTLVQLWVRDPSAVRRAAQRIARNYDRELRPQFESLGVDLGHELAPQLERLTSRAGRDLSPEFARLGAALGASILSDLAAGDAGSGEDFHGKRKPKN